MESLAASWSALDARRRLIVILATVAVFAAVLFLARGSGSKDYALLFGGLEAGAAGDVITALDQTGVMYEVRGNAIYVDPAQRDSLRMSLAANGLPASGGQGYELLDSLSGFGTTSQMFDAAYARAKEGELARTILASPHIRSARVHISTPTGRPFQREQVPTAAVTIQTANGGLAPSQVKALQFLVASAVNGLTPDNVAVIDGSGGLLSIDEGAAATGTGDDRADALRIRAERLLAARVGPGNAVVEVSIDTVMETETISERTVDPESRVAISTDVQESAGKSQDSRGGNVTVASNLPDGDGAGGGNAQNENSETRALTNYEVSEVQRDILRAPGAVRRLTVAVLVNEVQVTNPDGSVTTTPRTAEELAALEELVASAVGFDADRGDEITLRSMQFEPLPELGTEAGDAALPSPFNMMQLIQIGVLAVVALILGLFVVRPILNQQPVPALPAPTMGDDGGYAGPQAFNTADFGQMALPGPDGGDMFTDDDPVSRMRSLIADRESEAIQILQGWMESPDQQEKV